MILKIGVIDIGVLTGSINVTSYIAINNDFYQKYKILIKKWRL